MTPDDEELIERYLRSPAELTAEERQAAERLLDQDPAAGAYRSALESFYAFLEEGRRTSSSRVEAFVDSLFEGDVDSSVVPLEPFRPTRSSRTTVFAAATEGEAEDRRFSVLATLAAEDEQILVRVIEDRKAERGRVYVLAESPDQQSHVIVSFPGLGLDVVTDENGQLSFDLPSDVSSEQWAQVRAVVRSPVSVERLAPNSTTTLPAPSGGGVKCDREDGSLSVTLQDPQVPPGISLLTVHPVGEAEDPHLFRLGERAPFRHPVQTDEALVLRVYE